MSSARPLLGVVGPTASGKTDLALALAARLPIEILVADSRQVYRGMDVGTTKPDAAARDRVPHHLLDLVDPDQPFSVADWVSHARVALDDVTRRGRIPMLVGGTGLYVTSLVDGHQYAAQARSPDVRRRLSEELEAGGLDALAGRLQQAAPELASTIDLRNPRRVVRALERVEVGGQRTAPPARPYPGPVALVAIDRPREALYRRIDARARRLFVADGLLDEVARLVAAGYGPDLRPMSGHGYGEAIRHLAGEWSLERAIDETARRTRQYAKRQLTWFRRDARTTWIQGETRHADDPDLVTAAERALRAALS